MDLLLEPQAWLIVVLFTMLGVVGNLALYQLGKRGVGAVQKRFPRITPERWQRVQSLYENRGSWILLLSGIPVLGAVLTTGAGAFGVTQLSFLFWVGIAKLARNWLVVVVLREGWLLLKR